MDEQTTPKKVRRVGSIAFALVLIAAGVLLIVYQFVPQFDLLKILKFSPVILVALGIEMLVYSARPDVKVKFDWLAIWVRRSRSASSARRHCCPWPSASGAPPATTPRPALNRRKRTRCTAP